MNCEVCTHAGDPWTRTGGIVRQLSLESEHDLAAMVSDFLENESDGTDSRCSTDSDSGFSDLLQLADKISFYKRPVDQYEYDLLAVVHSLLLSLSDKNLNLLKPGFCKGSCILYALVKLLRHSGYDAAVCEAKWQASNKVPGGDHEYIDLIKYNDDGTSERLIIDIDFQSHFDIARAVKSYDDILKSLPTVYVGSPSRLKQLLLVMVEAIRASLKHNSMPLPPWRSLAYLQSKWYSPFQRRTSLEEQGTIISDSSSSSLTSHKQCAGQLTRVQSPLQSEVRSQRIVLSPLKSNTSTRRMKLERRKSPFNGTL